MGGIIAAIGSLVVGGAVAGVTIFGLINGQVNSPADFTGDASNPTIDYGSTE